MYDSPYTVKALNFINENHFVKNVYDNMFCIRKFCNNMTRRHWAGTMTLGRTAIFTTTATLDPHRRPVQTCSLSFQKKNVMFEQNVEMSQILDTLWALLTNR